MLRLHNGLSIKPLDAGYSRTGGAAVVSAADEEDSLVQSIFRDVVGRLSTGGGSGNSTPGAGPERIDR